MQSSVPRSLLVILRAHLGVILIITVIGKLFRPQPFSVEMLEFIASALNRKGIEGDQEFLRGCVVPHATRLSYLVMARAVAAHIPLLTGRLTRGRGRLSTPP